MKKKYEPPKIEVLVLEQEDVITASPINGGFGVTNGTNEGTEHKFGWDD